MKWSVVIKYGFILYIVLFCVCLFLISSEDRYMYLYSLQHTDYFLWHLFKFDGLSLTIWGTIMYFLYINYFPIIALFIPDWDKVFHIHGSFDCVPYSLMGNKELTYKVQSKLFWYHCFTENGIKTPKIYYHVLNGSVIPIHPLEKGPFILKPNYGTQGIKIRKIEGDEIKSIQKDKWIAFRYDEKLIQEYVSDCFVDTARHFRIITSYKNDARLFAIKELKQDGTKIASNHANGANAVTCKLSGCDFLSEQENRFILKSCVQLLELHEKEFKTVPFIGWDVCLTCDGPYVFEGNLGASMGPSDYYPEYKQIMAELYKTSFK